MLSEFDDFVLCKDFQDNVRTVHLPKRRAHFGLGEMRRVAGTREMGEREFLETRRGKTAHEIGRLVVREMAARTVDALND